MQRNVVARTMVRLTGLIAALIAVVLVLGILAAQPAQAVSYSAEEVAFAQLINNYRVSKGLQPLLVSDRLSDAGDKHSSDMAKYRFFSHTTVKSDWFAAGASPWDRMAACGYNYSTNKAENIAAGQTTAAAVFEGWKNSSGHNTNMLSPNYKVIGISLVKVSGSPYGYYWTTDFGGYVDSTAHQIGTTPGSTTTTTRPAATTTTRPPATTTTTMRSPTTTLPPITTTTTRPPVAPGRFSDVGPGTPYYEPIQKLARLGIVCGYPDGRFKPSEPLMRQQFAKMIALALNYDFRRVTSCSFRDIEAASAADPFYPGAYIAACVRAGIIQGKTPYQFAPRDNTTRAQLITIVARAAGLNGVPSGYKAPFGFFSPDHYPWAVRAHAAGLLEGLRGLGPSFNFLANASRGEACLLLYNLLS